MVVTVTTVRTSDLSIHAVHDSECVQFQVLYTVLQCEWLHMQHDCRYTQARAPSLFPSVTIYLHLWHVANAFWGCYVYRRVRIVAKIAYYLRHVRLSVLSGCMPTGRSFIKHDIGYFHENCREQSKFGSNRALYVYTYVRFNCRRR